MLNLKKILFAPIIYDLFKNQIGPFLFVISTNQFNFFLNKKIETVLTVFLIKL